MPTFLQSVHSVPRTSDGTYILSPTELETIASLPENPALYIIRRLTKRHLPRNQGFLKCLDRLAKARYHKRR